MRAYSHVQLIALCSNNGKAKLFIINTQTPYLIDSIDLGIPATKMALSPKKDTLYLIGNSVHFVALNTADKKIQTIAGTEGINWYGIGVDPKTGIILASDAKDYVSEGELHFISVDKGSYRKIKTGIIPSDMAFP